jgi:hypothetical protein
MARSITFDLISQGIQTFTTETWIDLGTIPSGSKAWFGYADYMPDGKTTIFELRTNTAGNSTGTTGTTTLLGRASVRDGVTASVDYYRNGRLSTKSVAGTGTEKMWLRLTSKSAAAADAYWWIYYTLA